MAKGYWVTFYKSVSDPEALKKYVELAMPAFKEGGARFLARGNPAKVSGMGLMQRVVVIEFDSVEAAIRTYESEQYQKAAAAIEGKVERDLRIVEGA
ncbi:MAG TPA: DUF1330 domain-containing protein [Usitatibacter sp.]|nr:DUF1330 domain-containing protein [Usitatibacter sp.]